MFLDQIKENTPSTSTVPMAPDGINTVWGFDLIYQDGVQPMVLVLKGDVLIMSGRLVTEVTTFSNLTSNTSGDEAVDPHVEYSLIFQWLEQLEIWLHREWLQRV